MHSNYTCFCQYMCSLGIEPTTFALLMQCFSTEPQEHYFCSLSDLLYLPNSLDFTYLRSFRPRADPRLLGALRKNYVGGGGGGVRVVMTETHLSVFHSVSNRARRKCSRNSISSTARYAFNMFFFFVSNTLRLYDIHVT